MEPPIDADTVSFWFGKRRWAAWVISGIGLALAGLSLWYLIIVKALLIGRVASPGLAALILEVIEIGLLAGFSLVLVYGGYWLVTSPFDEVDLWWTGLWTMIGLAGVVAIVALVTAFQLLRGQTISEPSLIQELLLASGGGAIGGLLIGVSTVRETIEGERAKRQRDTLLFVNELLRHNVLNGMQIILGNSQRLHEHVDEEGQELLETNEQRAETIAHLIEDVRALMDTVAEKTACERVSLSSILESEIDALRSTYPDVTVEGEIQPEVVVWADELLAAVFENLLSNAVTHNDSDEPHIVVSVDEGADSATVSIADNGPGVPDDRKESIFDPGEQGEGSIGQGLGLYLVETLVDRYGGTVRLEDNDPRGAVAVVELPYATS